MAMTTKELIIELLGQSMDKEILLVCRDGAVEGGHAGFYIDKVENCCVIFNDWRDTPADYRKKSGMSKESEERFYYDMLKEFNDICTVAESEGYIIQFKREMHDILWDSRPDNKHIHTEGE